MPEETKPADQNPQKGGSYVRNGDGSLDLVHATQPAVPVLKTDPTQRAAAPAVDSTNSKE